MNMFAFGSAEGSPHGSHVLPQDPAVRTGQLSNGLSYYIRANGEPQNRVFFRLVVNAGSILERADQQGLAHFVEHGLFLGTEELNRDEIVEYLESLGMRFGPDVNAWTGFDETVFMLQLPADDPEKIEHGLHILQQWAGSAAFPAEAVENERLVIQEEWRMGQGAAQRFRDAQFPVIFHDSRYASRLPIGKSEIFLHAEPDDLREFYHSWYRPELMAIIAVGDFDPQEMENNIRSIFQNLPEKSGPERPSFPVPDNQGTLFAINSDPEASATRIDIFHKQTPRPLITEDDYRFHLSHRLFCSMLNSRLNEIANQADAPFLSARAAYGNIVRSSDAALLQAETEEDSILEAFAALLEEAVRVEQYGFSPIEFERAKQGILRDMETAYNQRNTTDSQAFASEYTRHFLNNEAFPGIAYEKELTNRLLPEINLEEINLLAESYVQSDNRVVTIQAAETESLRLPEPDTLMDILEHVAATQLEPPATEEDISQRPLIPNPPTAGQIVRRIDHPETGTLEWELSNGIQVFIQKTDFQDDEVLFHLEQFGGNSLSNDRDYYSSRIAAALAIQSGIGNFTSSQLEHKLSGNEVLVQPFIGDDVHGFSGTSSLADLEVLLQLVYAYSTTPRFDQNSFQVILRQLETNLERQASVPEGIFAEHLQSLYAGQNIRQRPLQLENIQNMDFFKASEIYQKLFSQLGNSAVFICGNIDPDLLEPLVNRYLASLPAQQSPPRIPYTMDRPEHAVTAEISGGDTSRVALVFFGDYQKSPQHDYALQALVDSLRIQLREEIREDQGGTYSMYTGAGTASFPQERYRLQIVFTADPERAKDLAADIFVHIRDIQSNGPDPSVVQRVQEIHRRDLENNLRSNSWWLQQLRESWYTGNSIEGILDIQEMIENLDAETITSAAQSFIREDRCIQLFQFP